MTTTQLRLNENQFHQHAFNLQIKRQLDLFEFFPPREYVYTQKCSHKNHLSSISFQSSPGRWMSRHTCQRTICALRTTGQEFSSRIFVDLCERQSYVRHLAACLLRLKE